MENFEIQQRVHSVLMSCQNEDVWNKLQTESAIQFANLWVEILNRKLEKLYPKLTEEYIEIMLYKNEVVGWIGYCLSKLNKD